MKNKIAVLLTCYNRENLTLNCLNKIFELKRDIDVYVVDDNSTDNTVKQIENYFPQVKLIHGTGNLFWNRGMHLAWTEALKYNYSFYLWLNDDVFLYDDAFDELFSCSNLKIHQAIISGIIESKDKKKTLYGGTNSNGLIEPNGEMNPIDNLNGNVVLVPAFVQEKIGILDPVFHHDLGDVEYGLRARSKSIGVLTTRKAIAAGTENKISRVRKNGVSIWKRFRVLNSPLGSPLSINYYFRKKYKGVFKALAYIFYLIFLNIVSDKFLRILFGNKFN